MLGEGDVNGQTDRVMSAACGAMAACVHEDDDALSRVDSDDGGSETSLEGFDLDEALDHMTGAGGSIFLVACWKPQSLFERGSGLA